MSQLFVSEPGKLEWRDPIPRPILNATDAIVKPLAVARCDLDPLVIMGAPPFELPLEIGHEFVGIVTEVGEDVRSMKVGDRVTSSFVVSCGTCRSCRRGSHHSCREIGDLPAYYGFGNVGHHWGGAMSDALRIPHADNMLVKIPDSVSSFAAASVGDNMADAYRAVVPHLKEDPSLDVCIIGGSSQSIGLYAASWAVRHGTGNVHYYDTHRAKLELAETLGATAVEQLDPEPGHNYGIGVNSSGRPEGLAAAVAALDFDGRLTSSFIFAPEVTIPYLSAFSTGVNLTFGSQNTREHIPDILDALADGFDPMSVIGTRYAWSDAADAFLEPVAKVVVVRDE